MILENIYAYEREDHNKFQGEAQKSKCLKVLNQDKFEPKLVISIGMEGWEEGFKTKSPCMGVL